MEIKPLQKSEVPLLWQMLKDFTVFEKLEDDFIATVEDLEKGFFGENASSECFIGWEGNEPVGFTHLIRMYSTFNGQPYFWLDDLYIKDTFRGRGFGKNFMAFIAKTSQERGYKRIWWEALKWNTNACKFYESLGASLRDEYVVFEVPNEAKIEEVSSCA